LAAALVGVEGFEEAAVGGGGLPMESELVANNGNMSGCRWSAWQNESLVKQGEQRKDDECRWSLF
jgi:hypothetical protein